MESNAPHPNRILISGANSGIGEKIAEQYAAPKTHLFLTARNLERLEKVAEKCRQAGATVTVKSLDITDTQTVQDWVEEVSREGPLDLVIANAGIMMPRENAKKPESAEQSLVQIRTNIDGVINLAAATAPKMQERKQGHIVLIASLAGLQPLSDLPGYSASKAAVISYGEALHALLVNDNVSVTTICPGYISTPMTTPHGNWRPLEMSADQAAGRILHAIRKKRSFYAFPFAMLVLIKLGRFIPQSLRPLTTRLFNSFHR